MKETTRSTLAYTYWRLRSHRLSWALLVAVLLASIASQGLVSAQSSRGGWETPINLSKSGGAKDPLAVVDANGQFHVIWKDEFADWVYTSGEGSDWSVPTAAAFIFEDRVPRLFADAAGNIHAFWIDEEGVLFHGWAPASSFGSPSGWAGTQVLAAAAAAYDLAVDSRGVMHLAYVRNLNTSDFPAGVYYLSSSTNGASWSMPVGLYRSAYMRTLTEENASLDLAVTDTDGEQHVYVAWDNPIQKRVLLIASLDGGRNWGDVYQVDGPSPTTVTTNPFRLKVNPQGDEVLLVWNSGLQSGFDCTQYYQSSSDGGATWSERRVMFENYVGCPQDNQFIPFGDDLTLLFTNIQEEIFLSAWDGKRWSLPQPQGALFSFTNPDTFSSVDFRCRQPLKGGADRLWVVGCDQAGGGDIWVTSRQIGSTDAWFPPPTAWSDLREISTAEVPIGSVEVLVDVHGGLHALWTQREIATEGVGKIKLFYSRLEDQEWTEGVAVVNSPSGEIASPALAIDPDNRLFVLWRDSQTGEIYNSWSSADLAISPFEWTAPKGLPMPYPVGSAPDLLIQPNGDLMAVYAIPVNEGRGIYMTGSSNHGETWSTPVQIFDAASSEWVMVDHPRIAQSENGALHLLWTRSQLGEQNKPVALYYSSSTDGGKNWSEAQLVVEQPLNWLEIESDEQQGIHRMWLGEKDTQTSLWHQFSSDGGSTWSQPANMTRFGETPAAATLVRDAGGRLNLLQAVTDSSGKVMISHSIWRGERWSPEQDLTVSEAVDERIESLGAGISPDGSLVVAFSLQGQKGQQMIHTLLVAERQLADIEPVPVLTISPTPSFGGEVEPTSALAVATVTPGSPSTTMSVTPQTPTVTSPPPAPTSLFSLGSRLSGNVVGGLLAMLVVIVTAGLAFMVIRRMNR